MSEENVANFNMAIRKAQTVHGEVRSNRRYEPQIDVLSEYTIPCDSKHVLGFKRLSTVGTGSYCTSTQICHKSGRVV